MADTVEFKFSISESAQQRISELLSGYKIDTAKSYVVLHPGSGGSALDWPADKFGRLGHRILTELDMPVIVTGSSAETELVDRVIRCDDRLIRMDGRLSIKELAALLRSSALVISNSTGPRHIAVALSVPVIGLHCPIESCKPERWGPYGQIESVITPPIGRCGTCRPDRCENNNCMDLISVDDVFKMAVEKLAKAVKK